MNCLHVCHQPQKQQIVFMPVYRRNLIWSVFFNRSYNETVVKIPFAYIFPEFQVKDNKLNVDGFIQMEQMKYDYDSVKKQIVQDIAKECGGITDSDRCESAAKIFICIHNAAEARRLMFDM